MDIHTLALVVSFVQFMQALVLFVQYKNDSRYQGMGWWTIGSFILAFAFALGYYRDDARFGQYAIIGNNVMLMVGMIMLYEGICRFLDVDFKRNVLLLLCLLSVLLTVYFTYISNNIIIRRVNISLILALLSFLSANRLLYDSSISIKASARFLAAVFLVQGIFLIIRAFSPLWGESGGIFTPSFIQVATYLEALSIGLLLVLGFIVMINQRLLSENTEDKDNLEKIFNTGPHATLITRLYDGRIIKINDGFVSLSGYDAKEVIGRTTLDGILWHDPQTRAMVVNMIRKRGSCENVEAVFRHKNGKLLTCLLSCKTILLQGVPHIISVANDISERKAIENKLREQKEKLRAIFEVASIGVSITDSGGKYVMFNNWWLEKFGYQREEMHEMTNIALTHPEDREESKVWFLKVVAREVDSYRLEKRYIKKDGSVFWGDLYVSAVRDRNNEVVNVVGMVVDITARKIAEKALTEAKERAETANLMKRQFVANMSHELRTPINGIMGFLELLSISKLSLEQQNYLNGAKNASELLLYLISDILDFSKIEAGKLVIESIDFNLRNAVESAVWLLAAQAQEKGINLYVEINDDVPEYVRGDAARFRQILNNLLSNAVKFTKNGEVSVAAELLAVEKDSVRVRISVRDTGIGLSDEEQENLFQPFHQADASTTRKYGGTGLGLAISKELVHLMHGSISVESKPEKGSIFSFELSFNNAAEKYNDKSDVILKREIMVLVVDGDTKNRAITLSHLTTEGFITETAESAGEAITKIISYSKTDKPIDVIIADCKMADMDYGEFLSALQEMPFAKNLKIISSGSALQQAVGVCGNSFITKPVRRDDLISKILFAVSDETDSACAENQITINDDSDLAKGAIDILVVEDNEINRRVFTAMLESQGLACDVALNGQEALTAVSAKKYDLIFMDCQMPIMDGYESTKRIRAAETAGTHAVIVAMTANAMEGDREKCLSAGMDAYISKPIDFKTIFTIIEKHIGYVKKNMAKNNVTVSVSEKVRVLMEKTGIDEGLALSLYDDYYKSIPAIMRIVQKALAEEDFAAIAASAHKFKGSSANLRIDAMTAVAADLESAAQLKDTVRCREMLSEMEKHFLNL